MNMQILKLNKVGLPQAWVSREVAATLYVKDQVIWALGSKQTHMKGGINRHGKRSSLTLAPIIACGGNKQHNYFVPGLSNKLLFRRDESRCMYCGLEFHHADLTRDHVVPRVQGGKDIWMNVVAACQRCNQRKGGRTPEQAGMALLAVPFKPNVFEFMYLANHRIVGDQMEYLKARFTGQRTWLAA